MVSHEFFCVIECANWRAANVFWTSKAKEQCRKHRKRINDNLLQFVLMDSSQPSSSSNPISSSFLVCFDWFKSRWVCQSRLYKTSWYSKTRDATIKHLKLKILICFHSPIIEHWTPLHQTSHILGIPLPNWSIFSMLEMLGGRLNMFFELQNWSTMCKDSTSFEFLSVCWPTYLP
jgi:hypothetical protein